MSDSEKSSSPRQERLNQIIAEYLEAVEAGKAPDREGLLARHPDLAGELRAFFADHDKMKGLVEPGQPATAEAEEPTLPPRRPAEGSAGDPPTLPPVERGADDAATLPPRDLKAASDVAVPPAGTRIRYFGDYELLEEIARGGMGVVYKARQMSLNRIVALKMILAGQLASEEDVKRFYTEAEAAANLDHPGIVPIFEVGEHEGQHYFSMGYVDGHSLSAKIATGPLPPREAAELTKRVAEAVAYAHEKGVIHRDLKPANVLLDKDGQPRVTDFGLAKRVEGGSDLTDTGQILGTPSYMPPEQAAGKLDQITETADVYALGAIFYTLLTGRPPFQADNPLDTLMQVLEQEPVSPRQLNPKVPRDLETICLKCVEKESRRRYETANDLTEELQRFLNGEPILARPISTSARAWRWCRRKPALASLLAALVIVLLAGFAGVTSQWIRAENHAAKEEEERGKAERALVAERAAREETRRLRYGSDMNLALQDWEMGNVARVLRLLETQRPGAGETDLRGFEWFYLWHVSHRERRVLQHPLAVQSLAYSPDGSTLATGGWDRVVRLWDVATGRVRGAFGPHEFNVERLAFAPDGTTLAIASWNTFDQTPHGDLRFWDVATGEELHPLQKKPGAVRALAFSADGTMLATASWGTVFGQVKLWEMPTGKQRPFLGYGKFNAVAFSPDGKLLAAGGRGASVMLWDVATGEAEDPLTGHSAPIYCLAFAPDGQILASASFGAANQPGTVKLWNLASGDELATLEGHAGPVWSVAFAPDGKTLATGSSDMTIKLWDPATGEEQNTIKGHQAAVWALAFAPQTEHLLAAASFQEVKLWNLPVHQGPVALEAHAGDVKFLGFSSDGKTFFSAGNDGRHGGIKRWELAAMKEPTADFPSSGLIGCAAVSPDGMTVASAAPTDRTPRLWELSTGKQRHALDGHDGVVLCLAFSPDGKRLASGAEDGRVELWDVSSGHGTEILLPGVMITSLAFTPDGKTLATGYYTGIDVGVQLWDLPASRRGAALMRSRTTPTGLPNIVWSLAFSPDGNRLATGSTDGIIALLAVTGNHEVATFEGHVGAVQSLAFARDGRTLLSGGSDGTVKVWTATAEEDTMAASDLPPP